ncbi:hypothetical protein [Microlunatus soli]|uniref:Squalene cyclase n=1 Tax=Microlunatus soli TaxID=630515 RepID=A0A1H1ZG61_9ACTN|nr:hypothetical protein [Microlunatus soli]SDT32708.1 hypothetical protein SAMN04489812_5203 [Microlunatus soli]
MNGEVAGPKGVIEWLLAGDPAVRWQTMRDLTTADEAAVAAERSRVTEQGWGARMLALQDADGTWAGGACFPAGEHASDLGDGQPWIATLFSLALLQEFGIDPDDPTVRAAVERVRDNARWEHDGQRYFDGEVEECINGRTVGQGAYFGFDVDGIAELLLSGQLADGGWNCESERGSVRGSFHSTINVLEGLRTYQRRQQRPGSDRPDVAESLRRGEDYLLDRRLLRRKSTGAIIDDDFGAFSFPTHWYYDVLRALDYFRVADRRDQRLDEAISLLRGKQQPDGTWLLENTHPGKVHFALEDGDGRPSRWNTLRALRVLRWYDGSAPAQLS